MPRTFAIGDVHGHLGMLRDLLAQLTEVARSGDTLVFVGDYIDRGPNSPGVVDQVLSLREGAWPGPVVTLMGNHEDMLLDHVRVAAGGRRLYDPGLWEANGGLKALQDYMGPKELSLMMEKEAPFFGWSAAYQGVWRRGGLDGIIPAAHLEFFQNLQLHYEDEHAYYVHAGFRPGKRPGQCSRYERLWIRDEWIHDREHKLDKAVVFGHTPMSDLVQKKLWYPDCKDETWAPMNRPEKIGIDTGSCYGGPLTAVQLPERVFFTASNVREE